MKNKQKIILSLLLLITGPPLSVHSIEVHFEDATSGFFIKENSEEIVGTELSAPGASLEDKLSSNFTVLRSSELISLRASYGPFLSRDRVGVAGTLGSNPSSNVSLAGLSDLSAHLVTREVRKDKPVLRVLLHSSSGGGEAGLLCVQVTAVLGNKTVSGQCELGPTCLAQLTVPSHWWPDIRAERSRKQPKIISQVFYSLKLCQSASSLTAPQLVGPVPLSVSGAGYQQVAADQILHMLIPQTPLYPSSRLYVPVFVEQPQSGPPVTVIVVKCRARRGVRIEGIEETSKDWTLRIDLNTRGTTATVTAFRKDADQLGAGKIKQEYTGPDELFNWLYTIESSETETWDGGMLVWHVKYQHMEQSMLEQDITSNNLTKSSRLRHRLEIKKDDVQIVLPISKRWELINTAVLTGRQVSQPIKIFIVSEAGSVADVTLHTSCHTNDDSALKVSSSCTSVYVDGSETRGALNAEVKVKYGTISGYAYFTVWMAEIPLEISIPDTRLAQINNWKIPDSIEKGYQKRAAELENNWRDHFEEQQSKKFEEKKTKQLEEEFSDERCGHRYQQTSIKVFARFLAEDQNSGRREYLISRERQLEVTDLTLASVRTSDPRLVSITGTILQGHHPGAADIQVISPITNKVLASRAVEVVRQPESITGLTARVLSGLSLAVVPSLKIPSQFLLEASLSQTLSSKYQEGLLDITVLFSDGSSTPLRDIDPAQYYLTVDTLDPQVIAFAPIIGSKDTRVIAVGKGEGELLSVSLELADECHDKTDDPLATARVSVKVEFENTAVFQDSMAERNLLKERGGGRRRKFRERIQAKAGNIKSVNMGDLSEMFSNVALKDDNSRGRSQVFPYDGSHSPSSRVFSPHQQHHGVTPLEVGMYILLAVFCLAIAVFMASCFVYASKHSDTSLSPLERPSQNVQNAHDWVWLGRQTLDKSSVATSSVSRDRIDTAANSIRSGPLSYPPHRFEGPDSLNITQNPCGEFGQVNKRGLKVSNFSADVYAELPRKRLGGRQTASPQPEIYQNQLRTPLLQQVCQPPQSSPSPSRRSSRSSRPSVNSATYTRKKPVLPSQDILPVGYPVFSSAVEEPALSDENYPGFQNPWEALQVYRTKPTNHAEFFLDEEAQPGLQCPAERTVGLHLELAEEDLEDPECPELGLRQSPASGLPPYSEESPGARRGEYVPLNPDINKANPPRLGASRLFSDPFNVSDEEAPPLRSELLSPSHVFTSQDPPESDLDGVSVTSATSAAEDNCSSVCSVDSGELEMLDDLPNPSSAQVSPASSLSRHDNNKLPDLVDNRKILSPASSRDLNQVPLGSLDYEQLMSYFEALKESAA